MIFFPQILRTDSSENSFNFGDILDWDGKGVPGVTFLSWVVLWRRLDGSQRIVAGDEVRSRAYGSMSVDG